MRHRQPKGPAPARPCLTHRATPRLYCIFGMRFLIPDIVYGVRWIAVKMMGSIKSHASQELAVLKQQTPAAQLQHIVNRSHVAGPSPMRPRHMQHSLRSPTEGIWGRCFYGWLATLRRSV